MTDICYFPFTHICPVAQKTLAAFFPEVRILDLNPGNGTDRPGNFLPFGLDPERAAALEGRLAEYLGFARLHRGNERNLKYLLSQTPYFRTETDPTSIQSQIRGRMPSPDAQGQEITEPGLFLKLAHTLDMENQSIEAGLTALDQDRSALFEALRGDGDLAPAPAVRQSDSGETLPGKRIQAWVSLALETGLLRENPKVLVTTSPGIAAYLTDRVQGVINGLDIRFIKVHEQGCENKAPGVRNVGELLDQIIAGSLPEMDETLAKDSGCCGLSGHMKLWFFPGGELNRKLNIPGRQVAVCLVGLNS